jgi:predicted transcriptional regulator
MVGEHTEDFTKLDIKIRRDIYSFIKANPGLHLRALQRALNLSLSNLRYHLDYLVRQELLEVNSDGYRKTYFTAHEILKWDRGVLALLRQRIPRAIIIFLIEERLKSSFIKIQRQMNISKSSLSFQLKKLIKNNIIIVERLKGRNYYDIPDEDKERIMKLLIIYQPSFLDESIDRVVDVWLR